MGQKFWLMKTEPETFSIDDLAKKGEETWDGVRNYQSRNYMRDEMRVGDGVLFYHSNAEPAGVAGLAEVCRDAVPDLSALDPTSKYFDPKATPDDPRWAMVTVRFVEKFPAVVPLAMLRETPGLEQMAVVRRGNRLSITPVSPAEYAIVRDLGRSAAPAAFEPTEAAVPLRKVTPSAKAKAGAKKKSASKQKRSSPAKKTGATKSKVTKKPPAKVKSKAKAK